MADKGDKGSPKPDLPKPGLSKPKDDKKKTCSTSGESALEIERKKREQDCKELSIRYSLPTRMGLWFEDQTLHDERSHQFEKNNELCRNFHQKLSMMHDHLFLRTSIEKYQQHLKYGQAIQIRSEVTIEVEEGVPPPILKLSCLITEPQVDSLNMLKLDSGALVTVSYDNVPIRRNVFTCVSATGKPDLTPVCYGDDITLRIFDSDGPQLFLLAEIPNLETFGQYKGRIPVILSTVCNRFCKFRIVDPDMDKMIYLNGTPVPTFERVCLLHILTNVLLGVNLTETNSTMFCIDHPVEVYTYKDRIRGITSENFWTFLTQDIAETTAALDQEAPSSTT